MGEAFNTTRPLTIVAPNLYPSLAAP